MKKIIEYIIPITFAFLFFSFIILTIKLSKLEKAVELLKTENSIQINDIDSNISSSISDLSYEIEKINESIIESQTDFSILTSVIINNTDVILQELSQINGTATKQYSQTKNMKETYDTILNEQKKKTVDSAEKEGTVLLIKKSALSHYKAQQYSLAFEEYRKVVEMDGEDLESRSYKMKSLYYMNKADSTRYKEILADISILRAYGYIDDETIEIEKAIKAEKGGLDE
jgi:hypothetical protein